MRLPLRWVAILYGRIGVDMAATSGVHTSDDAVKLLMAGATVTMMASSLFRNGIEHLGVVKQVWLIGSLKMSTNHLISCVAV
jgi:dihydroorotate dehydrogenase (fumarate)